MLQISALRVIWEVYWEGDHADKPVRSIGALIDVDRARFDRAGHFYGRDRASVKLFCSEVAARVVDRCLQLHGGYGYMNEYPIARAYTDIRVHRIYGGTSEVMKMIIAKDMGL